METLTDRVGRYARGHARHKPGDQCRNYWIDQQKVIAALNVVPIASGGTGATLGLSVIDGTCDDKLYQAILNFEKKQFPKEPPNGFVDRSGPVYTTLFTLSDEAKRSVRAAPPDAPQADLDTLRRNVEEIKPKRSDNWNTGDIANLAILRQVAIKYIDDLKNKGKSVLPAMAVVFGRAYILQGADVYVEYINDASRPAQVTDRNKKTRVVVDMMNIGTPLLSLRIGGIDLVTFGFPALILYDDGVLLVPREEEVSLDHERRWGIDHADGPKGQWVMSYPVDVK